MSTPIEDLSFIPTGATTKRSLADWSSDTVLNVLNFGADPTGASDSWAAIQACLDVAFGTYASPHGHNDSDLNKPVYFPAGTYRVSKMLIVHWVRGGYIYGAGSACTRLIYDGLVPAVTGIPPWYSIRDGIDGILGVTALIATNGVGYSKFKGLSLEMPTGYQFPTSSNPGDLTLSDTSCLSLDWYQISDPNEEGNTTYLFEDMKFRSASVGLMLGIGDQTDTNVMLNCIFEDCAYGVESFNLNALQHKFIGCKFVDCWAGIYAGAGSFPINIGMVASGTNGFGSDYVQAGGTADAGTVIGCHTARSQFLKYYGPIVVLGCHQTGGTNFLNTYGAQFGAIIDTCMADAGVIDGVDAIYVRNSTLGASAIPVNASGGLREWMGAQVFTYSDLSGVTPAEGCKLNISDATTATWGANVTAGSGSNKVLIRYNGTNWTVVGK